MSSSLRDVRPRHVLGEADDVTVEIAHLEFLHAVDPQLRRRDDVGAAVQEFGMKGIDVVDPKIGVERVGLVFDPPRPASIKDSITIWSSRPTMANTGGSSKK
jgi:hypothetical protein